MTRLKTKKPPSSRTVHVSTHKSPNHNSLKLAWHWNLLIDSEPSCAKCLCWCLSVSQLLQAARLLPPQTGTEVYRQGDEANVPTADQRHLSIPRNTSGYNNKSGERGLLLASDRTPADTHTHTNICIHTVHTYISKVRNKSGDLIIMYLLMHLCNQYCAFFWEGTKITTTCDTMNWGTVTDTKVKAHLERAKKKNCWHAVSLTLYWTIVELQWLVDQSLPLFNKIMNGQMLCLSIHCFTIHSSRYLKHLMVPDSKM